MRNTLIVGERYKKLLEKPLCALGVTVFWMKDNLHLDKRLAGHADLSALKLDGKRIIASGNIYESEDIVNYLTKCGYELIPLKKCQARSYPDDASLCACIIGKRIIHNLHCTEPSVLKNFNGEKIHVNQGYAKCSACVINDNAMITADIGIATAAENCGIDVLRIKPGGIILEGFDYGFIGGATILLEDAVFITGMISDKHDKKLIESFINEHGKRLICLTSNPAFDIGGAIVF